MYLWTNWKFNKINRIGQWNSSKKWKGLNSVTPFPSPGGKKIQFVNKGLERRNLISSEQEKKACELTLSLMGENDMMHSRKSPVSCDTTWAIPLHPSEGGKCHSALHPTGHPGAPCSQWASTQNYMPSSFCFSHSLFFFYPINVGASHWFWN